MSMQPLVCPHCGRVSGNVAVTDSIKTVLHHLNCSRCHKKFSWQGEYGHIITYK